MELLSRVAYFLDEPRFYMHMDIFQGTIKGKHSRLDFFSYFIEALHNAVFFLRGQDPDFLEHLRVGFTARDVLFIERPVKID